MLRNEFDEIMERMVELHYLKNPNAYLVSETPYLVKGNKWWLGEINEFDDCEVSMVWGNDKQTCGYKSKVFATHKEAVEDLNRRVNEKITKQGYKISSEKKRRYRIKGEIDAFN